MNESNLLLSKWSHFTILALTCKGLYNLLLRNRTYSAAFEYMRLMAMRVSMRVTLVQDCLDREDPRHYNLCPWKYMYGPIRIDQEIEFDPLNLPKPRWVSDYEDTSKYVESCHLSGVPMGVPFHMCNHPDDSDHPEDHAMEMWKRSGINVRSLHTDLVQYKYDHRNNCIARRKPMHDSTPGWRQLCSRYILYVFQSNAKYACDEYDEEMVRCFVYLVMPFREKEEHGTSCSVSSSTGTSEDESSGLLSHYYRHFGADNSDPYEMTGSLDQYLVQSIQNRNYFLVDTTILNTRSMYPDVYQNVMHSSYSDMNTNARCHFPINKLCERCPIDWLAVDDEEDSS